MTKKVSLTAKPQTPRQPSPDEWVSAASPSSPAVPVSPAPESPQQPSSEQETIKRLTIDIPSKLHSRIKSQCALKGSKMADEIRLLLEERFPE